jgi:hypothetical protein
MNDYKLGYSTVFYDPTTYGINQRIREICELNPSSIELATNADGMFKEDLTNESIALVKSCGYRSIHAPSLPEYSERVVSNLLNLAKAINANVIVFHPDKIRNFQNLYDQFGSLIAIENMDRNKDFGTNVEDLKTVFHQLPTASWVCDINHLYSLDPTLGLATKMHDAFADRLAHYHISGYGGLHSCFSLTHELVILDAIKDYSKPLINEGGIMVSYLLKQEDAYVRNYLKDK